MLESSSGGGAGLAVLILLILLLESWPARLGLLQLREVSKILLLSYFRQTHGVCDTVDSCLLLIRVSFSKNKRHLE